MDMESLAARIREAAKHFPTYAGIEDYIVNRLSEWELKNFPRFLVRRVIPAVLRKTNPNQLEMLIDHEPFPIVEVTNIGLLRQRIAWENARSIAHAKRRDILQARLNVLLEREKEQQ